MAPIPPVQKMAASAGKARICHGFQIHRADATADARFIQDGGEERPAFIFFDFAFGLEAANLFIERVENLLARGRTGECRAVKQSAAKAAIIEKALGRAIEHDAHSIEQIDQVAGAESHMALTGGWLARKSPP